MTATTLSLLDQAELMQLALNASAADDSGAAIGYLKEAASRPDASGATHYILGAEYAQINMYERAIGEMAAALALDPALSIARLQLGLLWLSGGASEQAATVLGPLETLAPDQPLRLFGKGLCHLMKDELADARACLLEGIALNSGNPPLNGDMQKIIHELDLVSVPGAAPVQPDQEADADDGRQHVLLTAYTGKKAGV